MKHLILIFVISAMSLYCIGDCRAQSPNFNDDLTIDIKPTKPIGGVRPLNIYEPDIEATYSMGAITFVFNEDLGNCDIEVTNIDTGEVWYASCVGISSTIVYTSGSEGQYYIYIDTDSGAYTGEYTNY